MGGKGGGRGRGGGAGGVDLKAVLQQLGLAAGGSGEAETSRWDEVCGRLSKLETICLRIERSVNERMTSVEDRMRRVEDVVALVGNKERSEEVKREERDSSLEGVVVRMG